MFKKVVLKKKKKEKKKVVFLYDSSYLDCYRCSCGNCSSVVLQNLSECYCCPELDACKEAMCSESVLNGIFNPK